MTCRQRVLTALRHEPPDRTPVDFLATPEIWTALIDALQVDPTPFECLADWLDPRREAVLAALEVDCRLISYDMFLAPPADVVAAGQIDYWDSPNRSTPNRMWRLLRTDGTVQDIWGVVATRDTAGGAVHENYTAFGLAEAESVEDLHAHPWPRPDWWDFSAVPQMLDTLREAAGDVHVRFRLGSVFEIAWQLRGMERFMMDLALAPEIPCAIMDRLTDVHVANCRRVLELADGRIDMLYMYDDVATAESLMISRDMWERLIRPRHQRIIDVAREFGVGMMYHCDGAVRPLLGELTDMGVTLLNPVQTDAPGMEPAGLKAEFGDRLSFHGGVDILELLPRGTAGQVRDEVRKLIDTLGADGGYILSSSHHIQPDTPVENVLAMYETGLR